MANKSIRSSQVKIAAVVVWLAATLSLAGWWLVFGLQQLSRLQAVVRAETAEEIARRHRMLMSEGLVLFALLLGGGIALLYFMVTEIRRSRQIREFFAAFTHDLKTSLASLRLQAETLEEELKGSPEHARVSRRLVKDTVRLELQLDNSLFVADTEMGQLHLDDVSVRAVVSSLRHYWPELDIRMEGECRVRADVRALESILKNLLQNAVVHGKASRVEIRSETVDGARVALELADNGRGFPGDVGDLGRIFVRHTTTSGSGIGLHIAKKLAERMGGELRLIRGDATNPQGFRARLELHGRAS